MDVRDVLKDVIQIGGILFALSHFIVGFILYRDMVRINRVLKTPNSRSFMIIANLYIFFLLIILIGFILV